MATDRETPEQWQRKFRMTAREVDRWEMVVDVHRSYVAQATERLRSAETALAGWRAALRAQEAPGAPAAEIEAEETV